MSESSIAILLSIGLNTILSILVYLLKTQHNMAVDRIKTLEDRMREHHENTHLNIAEEMGALKERTRRCEEREDIEKRDVR